jgi:hypothetical protein
MFEKGFRCQKTEDGRQRIEKIFTTEKHGLSLKNYPCNSVRFRG